MFRVYLPHELPCAIGASPFRIKGMAYRQTWESCADLPGGPAAVAARLPGGEAGAFLQQTFLAGGWYDVLPMIWLDAAKAEVAGLAYERSLAQQSARHARATLGGIYQAFLRLISAGMTASVLPRMMQTYYDFGELTTSHAAPDHVSVVVRGIPLLIADWYMICSGAFVTEALSLGGAHRPSASWGTPKASGMRGRFALTDLTCHLRWGGAR